MTRYDRLVNFYILVFDKQDHTEGHISGVFFSRRADDGRDKGQSRFSSLQNVPHTRPDSPSCPQQHPGPLPLPRPPQTPRIHVRVKSLRRPSPLRHQKEAVKTRRGPSPLAPSSLLIPQSGNPQENRVRTCPKAHHLHHVPVWSQQTSRQASSGQGNSRRPQAQSRPHRPREHHRRRSKPVMCCQAHRLCPRRRR